MSGFMKGGALGPSFCAEGQFIHANCDATNRRGFAPQDVRSKGNWDRARGEDCRQLILGEIAFGADPH